MPTPTQFPIVASKNSVREFHLARGVAPAPSSLAPLPGLAGVA